MENGPGETRAGVESVTVRCGAVRCGACRDGDGALRFRRGKTNFRSRLQRDYGSSVSVFAFLEEVYKICRDVFRKVLKEY